MTLRNAKVFADRLAILWANRYPPTMSLSLQPTTHRALITGASEGIGRAFAHQLAAQGYAITVVARNQERLDLLLSEVPGKGHQKIIADLATDEGVALVERELLSPQNGGRYTRLINNAGFGSLGDFAASAWEIQQRMIALNISALVRLSHVFLRRAKQGDSILQVSSTLSFLPMPAQPVYSATKAFVTSFTETLWYQCRERGVTIVNLCPGATRTHFQSRSGGRDDVIPDFVLESPERVAAFGLSALDRAAGPTVISGWKNRLAALTFRILPRKALVLMMGLVRE